MPWQTNNFFFFLYRILSDTSKVTFSRQTEESRKETVQICDLDVLHIISVVREGFSRHSLRNSNPHLKIHKNNNDYNNKQETKIKLKKSLEKVEGEKLIERI